MKPNKKGQLQISFNWIFVLIAGAVILLFFVTTITKEKDASQTQLAQKASTRLDAIFSVIQQNQNSIQIHDAPNYEMDFHCTEEGHYYSIKDSSTKNYLENDVIFAPETIGRAKLVTWTKTFTAPFPVTSTLFLTDEKNQYIFLTDSPEIKKIYNDFPDKFSKINKTSTDPITDEGFRKYIIITDSAATLNLPNDVKSKTQKIIEINEGPEGVYSEGTIKFYNPSGSSSTDEKYVGQELLMGAIVSGDPDLYSCALNKILKKTEIVSQQNYLRTQKLWNTYAATYSGRCTSFYGLVTQGYMQNLTEAAQNFESTDTTKNYQKFYETEQYIASINENILRSDCTLLY